MMPRGEASDGPPARRIGFLVNPIAGMGGRVGLKGTDGVVELARRLGAEPVAPRKAGEMLQELRRRIDSWGDGFEIRWLTCSGPMGADCLRGAGFDDLEVTYEAGGETRDTDTKAAVAALVDAGAELIVFCGGDGTARDVCAVTKSSTPILGIPAGVKMYSGVFGISPARTADILFRYLESAVSTAEADILDLDEEAYRQGEWIVRLCDSALTPCEPALIQTAKILLTETTDHEAKEDIAARLLEEIERDPDALFLLGAGSTVGSIGKRIHVDKTLLGVDGVAGKKLVGKDLNERQILELLDRYPRCTLILSPIGAQGFVLGRGNQQLSPAVVRRIGAENVVVVATPSKLSQTPVIRFDTGDPVLDAEFAAANYLRVITGYRQSRMVKVEL
jgi:predicted polyphosphate/ATP-dependent NAD kinase